MARDERLRAGFERLKTAGIGENAPIADLERVSGEDPDGALAVAALLGDRPSEDSAALLERIGAGAAADKELRREVRRSLYRLAQKGVARPAAPSPAPAPPPSLFAETEPEGFLSPMDSGGDRLLWIVKPRSGGGLFHLSLVVNEPEGLREAVLADVSRKALRTLRREIESRHGVRLVDADWRYCDWIGHEGYERARARGPMPEAATEYPQLRMQLFRKPAAPAPAPISRLADPDAAPDESRLATSAEIFAEPDFQYWFLSESVLAPFLTRYAAMRDSPIVLDRAQQLGRVEEIVGDALRDLFGGERAASWRRRLEETAYSLWKTGREEPGRRVLAASQALGRSNTGAKGIPLLEELVRRSFGLFLAREVEKQRDAQASSVLVTPEQIREEQARRRR